MLWINNVYCPFPSFNRQTDAALESHIEEVWTERVTREPWLFNGSKFRLHSFTLASPAGRPCTKDLQGPQSTDAGDKDVEEHRFQKGQGCAMNSTSECTQCPRGQQEHQPVCCLADVDPDLGTLASPRLTLRLGLTCYKDFLGTNWSHLAGALRGRGEAEFSDPCALLAQPLGVGGVLCTRDGMVVLIRRSRCVAEAGGLLDIPGGHPEPQVREPPVCI